MIKWGPSSDGYCTSKDGKWKIVPLYCGRVKPQMYELRHDGKREGWHTTQRLAKERAEVALERLRVLGKT